jgi:hypothetical protein
MYIIRNFMQKKNSPNYSCVSYFGKWRNSKALVSVGVSSLLYQVSHMQCSPVTAHTAPSMLVDLVNLSDYLLCSSPHFQISRLAWNELTSDQTARFSRSQLHVEDPQKLVSVFSITSGTDSGFPKEKHFCRTCGTTLWTVPLKHKGEVVVLRTSLIENGSVGRCSRTRALR